MGEPPKKDYPPGWNDPPMLNYSPSNPPPKSRITNKRIAFPLGASQNSGQLSESPKMPTLPPSTGSACVEDLYLTASEHYKKCLEMIDNESIKEQIWQMLSVWQSGKFSENIQKTLTDLSISIVEGNTTAINEIHLRLAMLPDETSNVKVYLPALKCLINPSVKA